jgi:rRNA maturation protein Nop10
MLLELKDESTEADLATQLKARFGTQDQIERYRYELKARMRRKDESI